MNNNIYILGVILCIGILSSCSGNVSHSDLQELNNDNITISDEKKDSTAGGKQTGTKGGITTTETEDTNFIYPDGKIAENTWVTYEGNDYFFDFDGSMLKNVYIENTFYVDKDGKKAKGTVNVDGIEFDNEGKVKEEYKDKIAVPIKENTKVNDIVRFGRYEQDNNLENGPEEIEWVVLDINDEEAYLITKNVILTYDIRTIGYNLLDYLNEILLNSNSIGDSYLVEKKPSDLIRYRYDYFNYMGKEDILYKISTLTESEYDKYFKNNDYFDNKKIFVTAKPTKAVKENGFYCSTSNKWFGGNSPYVLINDNKLESGKVTDAFDTKMVMVNGKPDLWSENYILFGVRPTIYIKRN